MSKGAPDARHRTSDFCVSFSPPPNLLPTTMLMSSAGRRVSTLLLILVPSILAQPCSSTPFRTKRTAHRRPPHSRLQDFQRGQEQNFLSAFPRGGASTTASSTATTPTHHHGPKACRIFVWDVVSAVRFALCIRMLRENLYEGLGGRKFVRIRPGSILQSLYPCSDHAPDRCAICGFSFPDHLGEWWKPWLRSPFDTHLDRISETGIIPPEDAENVTGRSGRRGGERRRRRKKYAAIEWNGGVGRSTWPSSAKVLCFHKCYVEQVALPSADDRLSEKANISSRFDNEGYEYRKESNVHYRIPVLRNGPKKGVGKYLLNLAHIITVDELEKLVKLQEGENFKLQREDDQKLRL
mmetsp:Transcript_26436/g.78195  ORF Transcript_26436/g.78195 Transcript_26436/m.78195 type:complete len:352 (+) Transcript_26436:3-1058(+)